MRQVARRHDFALLLHEKPFAGVNGSGKHNNWSMATDDRREPARARRHPAREPAVPRLPRGHPQGRVPPPGRCCAAAIASSGNDHRLGANEAPPAIISVFIGEAAHRHPRRDRGRQAPGRDLREAGHQPRRVAAPERRPRQHGPQPHLARSPSRATSSSSARSAPRSPVPPRWRRSTQRSVRRSTRWPTVSTPPSRRARTSTPR